MSTTLLEQLTSADAESRAVAESTYLALVRRANAPKPGDADLLRATLATLGLTVDAVAADLKALKEADRLARGIDSPEETARLDVQRKAKREAANRTTVALLKAVADHLGDSPDIIMQLVGQATLFCNNDSSGWRPAMDDRYAAESAAREAENAHAGSLNRSLAFEDSLVRLKAQNPKLFPVQD